jgi:hypothetical protein
MRMEQILLNTCNASSRDYAALLPRDHHAGRVLNAQHHSSHVYAHNSIELLHLVLCYAFNRNEFDSSCVVIHDIELPVFLHGQIHRSADVLLFAHIAVHVSCRRRKGSGEFSASFVCNVCDNDFGSVLCEEPNNGFSDA